MAVKTVEGAKDDISAPGQCVAALDLLTGLPDARRPAISNLTPATTASSPVEAWRNNIRPLVLDFIDANSEAPAERKRTKPREGQAESGKQKRRRLI